MAEDRKWGLREWNEKFVVGEGESSSIGTRFNGGNQANTSPVIGTLRCWSFWRTDLSLSYESGIDMLIC